MKNNQSNKKCVPNKQGGYIPPSNTKKKKSKFTLSQWIVFILMIFWTVCSCLSIYLSIRDLTTVSASTEDNKKVASTYADNIQNNETFVTVPLNLSFICDVNYVYNGDNVSLAVQTEPFLVYFHISLYSVTNSNGSISLYANSDISKHYFSVPYINENYRFQFMNGSTLSNMQCDFSNALLVNSSTGEITGQFFNEPDLLPALTYYYMDDTTGGFVNRYKSVTNYIKQITGNQAQNIQGGCYSCVLSIEPDFDFNSIYEVVVSYNGRVNESLDYPFTSITYEYFSYDLNGNRFSQPFKIFNKTLQKYNATNLPLSYTRYLSLQSSSLDYNNGFSNGYTLGTEDGYKSGYNRGYTDGKNVGYNQGVIESNDYSFLGLLGAVVDAPISVVSQWLNFDLLGFNMSNFFFAICTLALTIAIIRLIL